MLITKGVIIVQLDLLCFPYATRDHTVEFTHKLSLSTKNMHVI